jgi:hypothetical protein
MRSQLHVVKTTATSRVNDIVCLHGQEYRSSTATARVVVATGLHQLIRTCERICR